MMMILRAIVDIVWPGGVTVRTLDWTIKRSRVRVLTLLLANCSHTHMCLCHQAV